MPEEDGLLFGHEPRLPPSNIEAEQALLGSLLANNPRTIDRCQFLRPEHFADPTNGAIFKRAMERIAAGQLADAVTLKTDFENTGVLEEYGGTKYLAQLITANVGWMATGDYARAIYDTWLRRKLLDVCHDASEAAYGAEPGEPVEEMINRAAEAVMALGEHGIASSTDLGVAIDAAIQRSEAAQKGTPGFARLDTGIEPVDALWGGLWPGQLYYLMARSRTGKTPFMMQLVRNVAARLKAEGKGEHVHVFSLEMTSEDLATINLASTTRWTSDQIRAGQIDDWHDFMAAGRELGRLPVVIDDRAEMDITGLFLRGRAIRRRKKTRLVCIDYRELIRRGRDQARMTLPEWIPFLGYQLKALAKTLNCPVIALAQINKTKSGEGPVRPTLDDLPYDGGQAADGVFALHRPELYMTAAPKTPAITSDSKLADIKSAWKRERDAVRGVAEFLALKRRFGPANAWRKLRFDGPRMLISDWHEVEPVPDHWGDDANGGVF